MAETKNTLMSQFIKIQNMQFELDKKKKEHRQLGEEIRSMAQKIPQMLRELNLK